MKKLISMLTIFVLIFSYGCFSRTATVSAPKDKYAKWVTNDNKELTKADFSKALAKCKYEAHKATIGAENQQFKSKDRLSKQLHELGLSIDKQKLFEECLKADGYELHGSVNNAEDLELVNRVCPDLKEGEWCFIR